MSTEHSEAGAPLATDPPGDAEAGRLLTRMALVMIGVVAFPLLAVDVLANDSRVLEATRWAAWAESRANKEIPILCYNEHFGDAADRLVHKDLPAMDFSRGGVILIGASNLTWAMKPWDLPADVRPFVHNFGLQGSNHRDQFDLIRYLVEEQGLLRAGGPKTLVVFGLSYHMTHNADLPGQPPHALISRTWSSRGMYSTAPDGSIRSSGLNPIARRFILEKAKITGFLRTVVSLAYALTKRERVLNLEFSRDEWTRTLGPRWEEKFDVELAAFERTVGYLKRRDVRMLVVDMPHASWNDALPFRQGYLRRLRAVCDRNGVEILDLSKRIADAEYADSVHFTTVGIEKFQDALTGRFLDHLRSAGVIPPDRSADRPRGDRSSQDGRP